MSDAPVNAPQSAFEDRWNNIVRPYSQVSGKREEGEREPVGEFESNGQKKEEETRRRARRKPTSPGQRSAESSSSPQALSLPFLNPDQPSFLFPFLKLQADVEKLRGSVQVEHTLARRGAEKLWELMRDEPFVPALGALSGGQAVQSVKAGLKAIYCSGWQVAADANTAGQVYPDQSLYPADAVPTLVKRLNRALTRADQIEHAEGGKERRFGVFFSPPFELIR